MDQLRESGWHINESLAKEFFTNGILPKSAAEISKTLLDEDIREFGEPCIVNLHRKDENQFDGPCVLQLVRYRNVSVPRIKEELNKSDPTCSIIRLFFTDGHTSISAILLQPIPGINADTPPGTKMLINGKVDVEGGIFMVLTKKDVKILGGRVSELIERWNVEKNAVRADGFKAKSAASKGTGAPKWVSFGKRGTVKGGLQLEKGFKANNVMPKNTKEDEDTDEFSKNREQILKDIDEEKGAAGGPKTFAKPNLAPPPPKEKTNLVPKQPKEPKPRKEFKRRGRKNSEDGPDIDVGEYANHKPSSAATLFDFIGGEEKDAISEMNKVVEQTARMNVSSGNSARSGNTRGPRFDRNEGVGISGNSRRGGGPNERQFGNGPRKGQESRNVRNEGVRPPPKQFSSNRDSHGGPSAQNANRNQNRNPNPKNQQNPHRGNQNQVPASSESQIQGPRPFQPRSGPSSNHFNQAHGPGAPNWRVGSQCLATWTDGNIYPATIVNILPNRTCSVRYNEYGNIHTLPVDFLIIP
uniref:Survival of motor neuron-related-splicing factor 30 n=1 Tax=Caenorhabditis japonica TaxID=281687 RepID=A0A8R1DZE8_CAEJA